MKIFSWNVNGLRAVVQKTDFSDFLETHQPDILFLQETKCFQYQVENLDAVFPQYHKFYNSAEKPGYSGTAVWISKKISERATCSHGMPNFIDTEGRIVRVDIENFSLFGVYFPNGGKSSEAWIQKLKFYEKFLEYMDQLREEGQEIIFCGDVNCAHEAIDLARPAENDGAIGFHPEERSRISQWIAQNFLDIWRAKNPEKIDQYSWWTYRGGARERNVGWRIDYFFADKKILEKISSMHYFDEVKGSDHCPVGLEIME